MSHYDATCETTRSNKKRAIPDGRQRTTNFYRASSCPQYQNREKKSSLIRTRWVSFLILLSCFGNVCIFLSTYKKPSISSLQQPFICILLRKKKPKNLLGKHAIVCFYFCLGSFGLKICTPYFFHLTCLALTAEDKNKLLPNIE